MEAGLLERFVTTVAFNRSSGHGTSNSWASGISGRLRRHTRGREIPDFLNVPVETFPVRELIRLAATRVGLNDVTCSRIWEWAETSFDRQVAATWAGRATCLYGCEHASVESFKRQKAEGGYNVLWQVIAHHRTVYRLLREEYEIFPDAVTANQRHLFAIEPRINARKDEQYALADLIVCNSEFSRQTFIEAGVPAHKLLAIPTGCPPVTADASAPRQTLQGAMVFLCAGSQSIRKGIPYLIEAWRRLQPAAQAELWLVGRMELPRRLLDGLPANMRIRPSVPRAELSQIFCRASVLVLPTLCEGLAHVVLEALAAGLAVITTEHSGCGDLVEDGVNGWKVPIRNVDALAESMQWCLDHPREVGEMQRQSLTKARSWQEEAFMQAHTETIANFLSRRKILDPEKFAMIQESHAG